MATTTAFSGFGFVPAGGADCCTCEDNICDPCPIECALNESTTVNLPEYYWLDITVDEGPNCCGGDWASGCYLLRNAESLYGAGTDPDSGDPNCSYYLAVDPDDVNAVLYAPTGYYDEAADDGVCGTGFSSTPLIRLTVTTDNLLVTFTVAEIDAPDSTPTSWTNYNDYEYSAAPSTIADYCSSPFTLAKGTGFMSCWPTDDFPTPPNNTAWPATASLQAADCEAPRDCPFTYAPDPGIETDCCPGFPVPRDPGITVLPDTYEPEPTVSVTEFSNSGGPGDDWAGSVTVENVSGGGGINCTFTVSLACIDNGTDPPYWQLTVDGVAYTEADGLEVQCPTTGVDGYVRMADMTVCTSIVISQIEITLPA